MKKYITILIIGVLICLFQSCAILDDEPYYGRVTYKTEYHYGYYDNPRYIPYYYRPYYKPYYKPKPKPPVPPKPTPNTPPPTPRPQPNKPRPPQGGGHHDNMGGNNGGHHNPTPRPVPSDHPTHKTPNPHQHAEFRSAVK